MDNQKEASSSSLNNKNNTIFTVKEAVNGFIATACSSGSVSYKAGNVNNGFYYDNRYLDGYSGEFVYGTLESAFDNAKNILILAKEDLKEKVDNFLELIKNDK